MSFGHLTEMRWSEADRLATSPTLRSGIGPGAAPQEAGRCRYGGGALAFFTRAYEKGGKMADERDTIPTPDNVVAMGRKGVGFGHRPEMSGSEVAATR